MCSLPHLQNQTQCCELKWGQFFQAASSTHFLIPTASPPCSQLLSSLASEMIQAIKEYSVFSDRFFCTLISQEIICQEIFLYIHSEIPCSLVSYYIKLCKELFITIWFCSWYRHPLNNLISLFLSCPLSSVFSLLFWYYVYIAICWYFIAHAFYYYWEETLKQAVEYQELGVFSHQHPKSCSRCFPSLLMCPSGDVYPLGRH